MKIKSVSVKNFRRLKDVTIDFEEKETLFVGPNNSGKTSATAAFKVFFEKQKFKVHDFSVATIALIDAFGASGNAERNPLPTIELDIWFSIDPEIEYGRASALIPNSLDDFEEVGLKMRYHVRDAAKLKAEYDKTIPRAEDGSPTKPLSHFLSLEGTLTRHFDFSYFALDQQADAIAEHPIDPKEGKKALNSLLRIDFIDAQRNIDDADSSRGNRLSVAFAAYYKLHLNQVGATEEANRIIEENNDSLTAHYASSFEPLMSVISGLGVPSVNDRSLKIASTLSPEIALKGNTDVLYVDSDLNHELPEAYNGLGFKNLIYMAIQINHFHLQWMNTPESRPLCQLIFIEEPEVHLHAQVQQTFISNIWQIINDASKARNEENTVPQLCITTHSSHILDAIEFGKARYFKRCIDNEGTPPATRVHHQSKVLNLTNFKPEKTFKDGEKENLDETLEFLNKYLRLTHCDLFFSDAAIIVEGAAEKLLLPRMIEKSAVGLKRNYLTILEVGGAYAHRFASLLEFIGIPYLVVTDIDSVDPSDSRKSCRADTSGAKSSNAALKSFLNKTTIEDLSKIDAKDRILFGELCFVTYQQPTQVAGYPKGTTMHGRTFEECFLYENIEHLRKGDFEVTIELPEKTEHNLEHEVIYQAVKSSSFKKTEFALGIAMTNADWKVPTYIDEGLKWLEKKIAIKLAPMPRKGDAS